MKEKRVFKDRVVRINSKQQPVTDVGIRLHKIDSFKDSVIVEIPLDKIEVGNQVRTEFDKDQITKLAVDIKENGIHHPITVMQVGEEDKYKLIIGENRFRACKLNGSKKIKAIVKSFIDDEAKIKLLQLSENLQRKNLNPIETAESLMKIKELLGITQKELAEKVGRSLGTIKIYSQIHNMTKEQKEKHTKENTGIKKLNEIMNKEKSLTVRPPKKSAQLFLFDEKKNQLILNRTKIDYKKSSKVELESKAQELENALKRLREEIRKK